MKSLSFFDFFTAWRADLAAGYGVAWVLLGIVGLAVILMGLAVADVVVTRWRERRDLAAQAAFEKAWLARRMEREWMRGRQESPGLRWQEVSNFSSKQNQN